MTSTQDSEEKSSLELDLPPQFESIEDLFTMPSERLKSSPLVNVIGLVKDFQPPIATKGSDWKCTVTLVDLSTQVEDGRGIKVMIFLPQEKMPHITGVRDVVILRKFKVQMWSGSISLLLNFASAIHVIPGAKVPAWPLNPSSLASRTASKNSTVPSPVELTYSSWIFHHISRNLFPDAEEFRENALNALKLKEKYSILKDIKAGCFYDLIGEAIQIYDKDGRVTLYLTDYTAHPLFYNHAWDDDSGSSVRDGDVFGYTKSQKKVKNDWPGPFGKLSFQVTLYDYHAEYVREQVKTGHWVILRNIHVKMGNSGGYLEGYLRTDRDAWDGKVQVQIFRPAEDTEQNDLRWKEGIRRKKEWWARFKKQKERYLEEAETANRKRKGDGTDLANTGKTNSKKRRKQEFEAVQKKIDAVGKKAIEKLDLNLNVKCSHPDKPTTPVSEILNHTLYVERARKGEEHVLPFNNIKHRSNVRVVDFWPHKLEDFAVGRKMSEYDMLSDYSGDESTDNEENMRQFRNGKGFGGEKIWEWRFALRVEDATRKSTDPMETLWLVVDNSRAQMLLNLDAVNLRQDEDTLTNLREVLFRLWGDLEEKKTALLKTTQGRALVLGRQAPSMPAPPGTPLIRPGRPGDGSPPNSDDDDDRCLSAAKDPSIVLRERDPNISMHTVTHPETGPSTPPLLAALSALHVANKAFTCCIHQYGIKVAEDDDTLADAGQGMRWKRVFGLFGTVIT